MGFFVCTFHTAMQNGTESEYSEEYKIASDPEMTYVLDNLPAEMSYEQKMQAIEGNYGKKYDLLHLWDVFGLIPKLEQFEAFIRGTYTSVDAFESLRPPDHGFSQMKAADDAREKIYKFSLRLDVRPRAASRAAASCPRRATACHCAAAATWTPRTTFLLGVRRRSSSRSCSNSATRRPAACPATRSGWRR